MVLFEEKIHFHSIEGNPDSKVHWDRNVFGKCQPFYSYKKQSCFVTRKLLTLITSKVFCTNDNSLMCHHTIFSACQHICIINMRMPNGNVIGSTIDVPSLLLLNTAHLRSSRMNVLKEERPTFYVTCA